MKKKAYGVLCCLIAVLGIATYSTFSISQENAYVDAAGQQSQYNMTFAQTRGGIYDRNLLPLVNQNSKYIASILPSIETMGELNQVFGSRYREQFAAALENGKPFTLDLDQPIEVDGVDVFEVFERYSEEQLAVQLIGHLDNSGSGVSGIEKAMDEVLKQNSGEVTIQYHVDAMGRAIPGEDREVIDTREKAGGVVLTLDSKIQKAAEEFSEKIEKGSLIVAEVPTGNILTSVSMPRYSPAELGLLSDRTDAPLLNRVFSAYSPGSVFKLITAAEEIESGAKGYQFDCTGQIDIDGQKVSCFGSESHGKVNLNSALINSCNGYFINAVSEIGAEPMLSMGYNMGFGVSTEFGDGIFSDAGNLPKSSELNHPRTLSNFALGQGDVSVTPLQITGMVNAIASGGEFVKPSLVSGTLNPETQFLKQSVPESRTRILTKSTANTLMRYMENTVKYGTGKKGNPNKVVAGAKTGTAQTNVFDNNEELNHFWYTGYIRNRNGSPKFVITVMQESLVNDKGSTAEIFKEMADFLADNYM